MASVGASGEILLMWDRRVVSKVDVYVGDFVAASLFRNVDDSLEWAFAGVYGPTGDIHRRQLWEELAGVMSLWDVLWCIGGDFNITLFQSEMSGGARRRSVVIAFEEFTVEQGLMDLPLSGGVSMWSNNRSWSRLDRFLVSPKWELSYPGLMQKKLLRLCSDYTPIFLLKGSLQNRKSSFKFENMWLKDEGFVDKVRNW